MPRKTTIAIITTLAVLILILPGIVIASPSKDSIPAPLRLKAGTFSPAQGEAPPALIGPTIAGYQPDERGEFIIQFQGPIRQEWKQQVAALGIELIEYLPDFAYRARMRPAQADQAAKLDSVVWVGVLHPAFKISPQLGSADRVRVQVTSAAELEGVKKQITALGGVIEREAGRAATVQLSPDKILELARNPAVSWIEPEPEYVLYNNIARGGGGGMDAYPMWGLGIFGDGQVAAVADTGLDTNDPATVHLDFRNRVVQIAVLGTDSTDIHGHGTHVAGSVVGNGVESGADPALQDYGQNDAIDPNQTTSKVTGIAPEASLYFQAISCNGGKSLCGLPADLNNLFQPTYDAGARIHSNS